MHLGKTIVQCAELCSATDECVAINVNTQGECRLQRSIDGQQDCSAAGWSSYVKKTESAKYLSGDCRMWPTSGWHSGIIKEIYRPWMAPNGREWKWTQCAAKCAKLASCEFWTLQLDGNKNCVLKSGRGEYNDGPGIFAEGSSDPSCLVDEACADTVGWTNGNAKCNKRGFTEEQGCHEVGWTCVGYATQAASDTAWCHNGTAMPKMEWALGEAMNYPEENCCVCGKGKAKGPAHALNPMAMIPMKGLTLGYQVYEDTCIPGHNIVTHHGMTPQQCVALCNSLPHCVAFEYGTDRHVGSSHTAGDCRLQDSMQGNKFCPGTNLDLYVKG